MALRWEKEEEQEGEEEEEEAEGGEEREGEEEEEEGEEEEEILQKVWDIIRLRGPDIGLYPNPTKCEWIWLGLPRPLSPFLGAFPLRYSRHPSF